MAESIDETHGESHPTNRGVSLANPATISKASYIRLMGRGDSGEENADFMARSTDLPTVEGISASWWTVWLEDELGDIRSITVEAPTSELAEVKATKPGERVNEILPSADPTQLRQATTESLSEALDILTGNGHLELEAMKAGGSFEDMSSLEGVLPANFASHYTPALVEEFYKTLNVVAEKLSTYPDTYLASTAEELAAHALIRNAKSSLITKLEEDNDADVLVIAAVLEHLDEIHEMAFEDWDVLMLFEEQWDGLESSSLAESMGMANLHPRDWFKPFRD
jgi:hypothetical protein